MTTLSIRKKLAAYLQIADDKKVKAMYALLETEIETASEISMEQYNKELELADSEIVKNNFISHNNVLKSRKFSKK